MPRYSEELIEEVRSRVDIVDVIGEYVHLKRKGSNYFGLCPFHNEKTGSFCVSREKQMFYCFGCGAAGTVFNFLMKQDNLTFLESVEILAERVGVELPQKELSQEEKRAEDRRSRLLAVNKEAARYYYFLLRSERGKPALDYFRGRGLSDETMQKFGLGCTDRNRDSLYRFLRSRGYEDELLRDSGLIGFDEERGVYDRFRSRAMFPIMNIRNKVIGFGGRVMGEGEPKYLNSPETMIFDKGRNLYGLNLARSTKRQGLVLCEGYMDVIALHQAGFDNAVASLGTSLTAGHAALLGRYTKEVWLSYDSDGAGVRAALRAIPLLRSVGIAVKVINMQPHKDPDELIKAAGAEEYQRRIDAAENGFLFELRMLERDYDLGDPASKTAFFQAAASRLLGFAEELERDNYIQAVARRYRVPYEDLRRMVGRRALSGEGTAMPVRAERPRPERREKRDRLRESQKLLLTWIVEDARIYPAIRSYLTAEDFTEEPYHRVASELFAQCESREKVNPARIISGFTDEEEQRTAVELFHSRIPPMESDADREKALKEAVVHIKRNSLKLRHPQDSRDVKEIQRMVDERKLLEQLEKIQLTL